MLKREQEILIEEQRRIEDAVCTQNYIYLATMINLLDCFVGRRQKNIGRRTAKKGFGVKYCKNCFLCI